MNYKENRNVWNTHYERHRSILHIPDENVVRYISHFIKDKNPSDITILDLGCGTGRHLNYLRQRKIQAFGMDYAAESLKDQQDVICADSHHLPFLNESFHMVIAWGVLHYMDREKIIHTLKEILRVLKSGGVFLGTIRSTQDSHLKNVLSNGDLESGSSLFFTKEEVLKLLSSFSSVSTGFISRTPLGENRTIAHHMFEAKK